MRPICNCSNTHRCMQGLSATCCWLCLQFDCVSNRTNAATEHSTAGHQLSAASKYCSMTRSLLEAANLPVLARDCAGATAVNLQLMASTDKQQP